jgi:hypothetical protein
MKIEETAELCVKILNEVNTHIIGKSQTLKEVMVMEIFSLKITQG